MSFHRLQATGGQSIYNAPALADIDKDGNLDVATSASIAISTELRGLTETIDNAIRCSIEGTLGSYEFGRIVDQAIREGIQSRSDELTAP